MKTLIAATILFGTTVGTTAAEIDSDYRNYFGSKTTATERTQPRRSKKTTYPAQDIDARRFDAGPAPERPDRLRPGYRNQSGIYVPPDYSTHSRGTDYDGFGSSANDSYGSYGSNPFSGGLGTRR